MRQSHLKMKCLKERFHESNRDKNYPPILFYICREFFCGAVSMQSMLELKCKQCEKIDLENNC